MYNLNVYNCWELNNCRTEHVRVCIDIIKYQNQACAWAKKIIYTVIGIC